MSQTVSIAPSATRAMIAMALLAFVAGFVDVVGFVALFGLFTAHVTGNFVILGSQVVHAQPGLFAKVLALPVFAAVVALVRLVVIFHERRAWHPARTLLAVETVALVLFMWGGIVISPVTDPDALAPVLVGMAGVTAMAVQNAAGRLVFAAHAPTTIMTGNTTQVVIDLIDMHRGAPEMRAKARQRLQLMLPSIVAFACGAAAGAYGFLFAAFWCLLAPIAGLFVAALLSE